MPRTKISHYKFLADKEDTTLFFRLIVPYIQDLEKKLPYSKPHSKERDEIKHALDTARELFEETRKRKKGLKNKESM